MLPKGLYDALPWLYMAVGALTAAMLEGDLRFMPALLFFVASGLVLMFRWNARSVAHRPGRASLGRSPPRSR
jgi:hypothetical protein